MDPFAQKEDGLILLGMDPSYDPISYQLLYAKPSGQAYEITTLPLYAKYYYDMTFGLGAGVHEGITVDTSGYVYTIHVTATSTYTDTWTIRVTRMDMVRYYSLVVRQSVSNNELVQGLTWDGEDLVILYAIYGNLGGIVNYYLFAQKVTCKLDLKGDPIFLQDATTVLTTGGSKADLTCDQESRTLYISLDYAPGYLYTVKNYDSGLIEIAEVTSKFKFERGFFNDVSYGNISFMNSVPFLEESYPDKKKLISVYNKLEAEVIFSDFSLVGHPFETLPSDWEGSGEDTVQSYQVDREGTYVATVWLNCTETVKGELTKTTLETNYEGYHGILFQYQYVSPEAIPTEALNLTYKLYETSKGPSEPVKTGTLTWEAGVEMEGGVQSVYGADTGSPLRSFPASSGLLTFSGSAVLVPGRSYTLQLEFSGPDPNPDRYGVLLENVSLFPGRASWKNSTILRIFVESEGGTIDPIDVPMQGQARTLMFFDFVDHGLEVPYFSYLDLCEKIAAIQGDTPATRTLRTIETHLLGDEENPDAETVQKNIEENSSALIENGSELAHLSEGTGNYLACLDTV